MRRMFAMGAAVLLAGALEVTTGGQEPVYPGIIGAIEAPVPTYNGFAHVTQGTLAFSGFALDCDEGTQPAEFFVVLRRLSLGFPAYWAPSSMTLTQVSRPDVVTLLADKCPAVVANVGYTLSFADQPPSGYWRAYVGWNAYYDMEAQTSTRLLWITP